MVERTGTDVEDLASGYLQQRVEQTIHADSLADARNLVGMLEEDPAEPTPSPTPSPSPSGTAAP